MTTHGQPSDEADTLRAGFIDAVRSGNADVLRAFITQHPDARDLLNAPLFSFGGTALANAVASANSAMVDLLLSLGADPNQRSDWWAGAWHLLHSARGPLAERLIAGGAVPDACAAANLDRIDLLRTILDEDPSRVHERGGDGQTPLHFARSRAAIDLILERGADVDARDQDHRASPAQWMLERRNGAGRYALAKYLVERGATADIFLAAALGLEDRARTLLTADPTLLDARTNQGDYGEQPPSSFHIYTWTLGPNLSPMQVAAQFDQPAVRKIMLDFATPIQRFVDACVRADAPAARALASAYPEAVAQLTAADHGSLADAAWRSDAKAVALMLEMGFDPMVPGATGGTALHCAACEGSVESVTAILAHPRAAELIELRDAAYDSTPFGWTCHGAANSGNRRADHAAVARLLLAAGANPEPYTESAPASIRAAIEAFQSRAKP